MYSNKHLQEVLCTYRFIQGAKKWDSTYFGQLFDKIVNDGFTERQEKKGIVFEVTASINSGGAQAPIVQEAESQMIFRNPSKNHAITMGNQFISFHIVSTYENWEAFNETLMKPFMEKYIELGIYEKILSCQVVYLNRFELPDQDDLSKYFSVISPPFKQFGKEVNVQLTKNYITSNGIVLNLRVQPQPAIPNVKNLMLECGATGTIPQGRAINEWKSISQDVKNPVRDFFESIITEDLRSIL